MRPPPRSWSGIMDIRNTRLANPRWPYPRWPNPIRLIQKWSNPRLPIPRCLIPRWLIPRRPIQTWPNLRWLREKKSGMAIATLGPEERPVGRPERYYHQSATQPTAYFEIDLRTCKNLTKLKLRSNGGLYFFRTQRIENSGANLS